MQEPSTSTEHVQGESGPVILEAGTLAAAATREIGRARRYQRSLAVVVLRAQTDAEHPLVAAMVRRLLRPWDVVGLLTAPTTAERGRVVAVLPETDADGAGAALQRVLDLMPDLFVGAAVCPEDGGTFGTLLAAASRRLKANREAAHRPGAA